MSFVNFIYFAYELEHKTETEQKQRALSKCESEESECAGE